MIEQTETELKMIVKNAYKEGHSRRQLSHDTYTAIYRLIRDIGDPALAQKCAISFPRYVNKINNEYAAVFQLINAYNAKPIFTDPDRTVEIITDDGRTVTIPTLNDIPEYAFDRGVAAGTYGKDYRAEVGKRLRNVAALAAKEDYESNVSLRNVAEMQIRYEKHLDDLDMLTREGVRLVWISTHSNCSKRCEPYQGKLYSLDGTSGKTDEGYTFEPLEVATDVYYTTKRGIRYKNGLFGFNCRHQMTPYTPGSKPTEIPDKVVEHQRELEKTQREFERAIRYEKTLYEVSRNLGRKETDDIARRAWHKAREINARYKEFCKENNLPYPVERVKIFKDQDPALFVDRLKNKVNLSHTEKRLVQHLTNTRISDTMGLQFFGSPEKQFGTKIGKHASDFGLDPSKEEDREKFRTIVEDVIENHEQVFIGHFSGQENEILFHVKENYLVQKNNEPIELNKVVVLTTQNNEFISVIVLKEGEENGWLKKARAAEI